jgi:hypothetical protein
VTICPRVLSKYLSSQLVANLLPPFVVLSIASKANISNKSNK